MSAKSLVNRPPAYSRQREKGRTDRAYVWLGGKRILLGVYNSPESRAKYNALITGDHPAVADPIVQELIEVNTDPTVNELLVAYLAHAEVYYRKPDGSVSREYGSVCEVAKVLRREAGRERAEKFGPKRLKAIRDLMIAEGWTRKFINNQVDRIRRVFRWGAAEELIPPSVPQALGMVPGLRKGRSKARESAPVRAVEDSDVKATLKHLPVVVQHMVQVQKLTGCRPGELILMRPCDINRNGKVWLYTPHHHKNSHHDHPRIIAIGPKCQAILLNYLARGAQDYLFQPRDSESKRLAQRSANRTVSLSCGNRSGSNRVSVPLRKPGEAYSVSSYRRAITRAANKAGVKPWTPHQLRHATATEVRKSFGLDAAQSVLGHRHAAITEVYAELHAGRAAEVALQIG